MRGAVLVVAFFLLFSLGGCLGSGIRIEGQGVEAVPTESSIFPTGGSGAGVVSTDNITVLIRTGATSFRGGLEGENIDIVDPFIQSGVNEVFERVRK